MIDPNKDAPLAIRKRLIAYGGLNPYGKPNWRVCLAQNVRVKRGGIFHEIEGGRKSMFVLGPDGKRYYQPIKDTITSGWFDVQRYPHMGWIIERWQPAHVWGTVSDWEAKRSEDGTPMMGPFPAQGDYFMVNTSPFPKIPAWGDLETSIAQYEREDRMRPRDFQAALKQHMKDEQDLQAKRLEAFEAELEKMRTSDLLPVLKSTSLAAQGFRNSLSEAVGDRSHFHVL